MKKRSSKRTVCGIGVLSGKTVAALMALLLVLMLVSAPVPVSAVGAASFSISGPSTLTQGAVGTYTVKVTVYDAAAAQARLEYDTNFFQLVSGNVNGVWDTAGNTDTTATLTSVSLRCIAVPGSSGVLTLSGVKASRLTGNLENPTQSVPTSVTPRTVANPVPTTTVTTTPAPTTTKATTSPTTTKPKPTSSPTVTHTTAGTTTTGTSTDATTTAASSTVGPTTTHSAPNDPGATGSTPSSAPFPSSGESGSSVSTVPESWPSIRDRISGLQTASLSARPHDSEVPANILQLLKDKKVTLTLDFENYSCRIDGSQLNRIPDEPAKLNISISMAPDADLDKAAGGNALYQLHFRHDGQLPGRFSFTIKANKNKPGDMVYLYTYHDQAGVIQGIQSASVDVNGFVTFEIFHCSSYFVSGRLITGAVNSFATAGNVNSGNSTSTDTVKDVPVFILVSGILATALIAALATMLRYRVGLFHKRER